MYLVGIDVGTTNTKVVIFDSETGQVRAVGHCPTITRHPTVEWSEFDADELWGAVAQSIRQAVAQCDKPQRIRAVSVASMGEAAFPLDAEAKPLHAAIAWHDPRTVLQAQWWSETVGGEAVYDISGQVLHPMFGINKLLWLRSNVPEIYQRIRWWLSIEDFILWKLTGIPATDYSIASRTMVFDQRTLGWSEKLLNHAGIPINWFPQAFPSGTPLGKVRMAVTKETGLPRNATVVVGGHDHLCGALAAGVTRPGLLVDSTGTASVILALSPTFQPSKELFDAGFNSYAYVLKGTYVTLGSLNFAGGALEWLVRMLYGHSEGAMAEKTYERALSEGASVPPGSRGVTILPYFLGTGTPHGQESARATILGLMPMHGRPEMVRALMEGLGFWLRDNLEALQRISIAPTNPEIIAVGGTTRAAELMQIKAEATGCRIIVPQITEAAATGAALLAGMGVGEFHSGEQAMSSLCSTKNVYEPSPRAVVAYNEIYQQRYIPARRSVLGN